jgi:glycosyltransferase involved in cell wall biosynthesis
MIIFHFGELATCGPVIQSYGLVNKLNELGIEACICSNHENNDLKARKENESILDQTKNDDIIIANWWRDIPKLEKFKGRKIQWVRTRDKEEGAKRTRQREGWKIIANSEYSGDWIEKPYTIIPNYVHPRFFEEKETKRDIDVLIEGNYEPNKNIDETLEIAKKIGSKIMWFGRQTKPVEGVYCIINPRQEDIPKLYNRSKVFLKLSHSEGFSTSILEAMASGCLVVTRDMGGNDYCWPLLNCWFIMNTEKDPITLGQDRDDSEIIKSAKKTASQYTIDNTINKLLKFIDEKNSTKKKQKGNKKPT